MLKHGNSIKRGSKNEKPLDFTVPRNLIAGGRTAAGFIKNKGRKGVKPFLPFCVYSRFHVSPP